MSCICCCPDPTCDCFLQTYSQVTVTISGVGGTGAWCECANRTFVLDLDEPGLALPSDCPLPPFISGAGWFLDPPRCAIAPQALPVRVGKRVVINSGAAVITFSPPPDFFPTPATGRIFFEIAGGTSIGRQCQQCEGYLQEFLPVTRTLPAGDLGGSGWAAQECKTNNATVTTTYS